jgi:hypothetical protein
MSLIPGATACQNQNGPQPEGGLERFHGGQEGTERTSNAFRHGLAALQRRRADGELTQDEQAIRVGILAGLIADKGGEQQIGTAERILAEIISSDVALLV